MSTLYNGVHAPFSMCRIIKPTPTCSSLILGWGVCSPQLVRHIRVVQHAVSWKVFDEVIFVADVIQPSIQSHSSAVLHLTTKNTPIVRIRSGLGASTTKFITLNHRQKKNPPLSFLFYFPCLLPSTLLSHHTTHATSLVHTHSKSERERYWNQIICLNILGSFCLLTSKGVPAQSVI